VVATVKRDKRVPVVPGSLYADVLSGYSLAYSASRRGISYVDAQAEFDRELEMHRADPVRARDVEHARLEKLLLALQPGIESGDVAAVREGRGISESLRKLDGTDARPDEAPAQAVKISFSFAQSGLSMAGRLEGPGSDDLGRPSVSVGGDGDENRKDDSSRDLVIEPDSGR
jgi:hypothetical protein